MQAITDPILARYNWGKDRENTGANPTRIIVLIDPNCAAGGHHEFENPNDPAGHCKKCHRGFALSGAREK